MTTITYNAFVSSEVPDAAHHEVDTSVVRDNFEKSGTLFYYGPTSTTINQVPSHYAFDQDLTGLMVGDMISFTRKTQAGAPANLPGMTDSHTGHITSIVWHLPASSPRGVFCFKLDTDHVAITPPQLQYVTIKLHSPRVPRELMLQLPHQMSVTKVELVSYLLSNMEITDKLKVGKHKSKDKYDEHPFYILEIDQLQNLTQRSNIPIANNAFAVLPTGSLGNVVETAGESHNVYNMVHDVQELGRAHTINKLTFRLMTPQGTTPRLHKCHFWIKLTVQEGLNTIHRDTTTNRAPAVRDPIEETSVLPPARLDIMTPRSLGTLSSFF